MKASKITNSIYSILNEDRFSKYTASQIYDELGEEEFVNYIAELVYKIIKSENIEWLKDVKMDLDTSTHSNDICLEFSKKLPKYEETLYIFYTKVPDTKRDVGTLQIGGRVGDSTYKVAYSENVDKVIRPDVTNIYNALKKDIIKNYINSPVLVRMRKLLSKVNT